LNLSSTPKPPQPWQAYLNKFQETKLKNYIDDAWQEHLNEVPAGEKPTKTLFEVRNRVAQKMYEKETPQVKQEVEEHRLKMRDSPGAMDTVSRNKAFQA
jgi:hypothetical protein